MTTQAIPPPRKRFRLRWRSALGCLALVLIVGCIAGVFIAGRMIVGGGAVSGGLTARVVEVERRDLVDIVRINSTLEPRERALKRHRDEGSVLRGRRLNGQSPCPLVAIDLVLIHRIICSGA